jgi:hypothetical protein
LVEDDHLGHSVRRHPGAFRPSCRILSACH